MGSAALGLVFALAAGPGLVWRRGGWAVRNVLRDFLKPTAEKNAQLVENIRARVVAVFAAELRQSGTVDACARCHLVKRDAPACLERQVRDTFF